MGIRENSKKHFWISTPCLHFLRHLLSITLKVDFHIDLLKLNGIQVN